MTTIPTAERIAAAAVTHFSSHGYDASSLARIAEAVGIRKASLYSHFSCKDELFMRVFSEALEAECRLACDCFAAEPVAALPGSSYCASLVERFEQSEQLRFLLRTGYMPPPALEPQISAGHEAYLAQLQGDFAERLGAWCEGRLMPADVELYGEVYLGLVLVVGLVAARLGFVVSYADAYLAEPMSLLDIRDGGWSAWWGLAAIWGTTLLIGYRRPAIARPLVKGMSALSLGVLLVVTLAALPTSANRPLPALPVTALDGEAASLPSFAGKPTVINLWASWCGPCRREMPMFQQAQEQHPEMHFVFLNQGEDAATVEHFLQRDGLELNNVLLDRGTEMGHLLGQRGLPVTLFFNAEGLMEDVRLGELSRGSLAQRLDALAVDD